uniref:G-protein coupled receptors family 1 profile domain-containing protein n=1 Tax=Acrobeloides nanus TaxID=290746 RepID=A0A914CRN6_9BILA
MFTFAAPLVGLSITMVSLDRLFAACRPTWYYKLDVGYAWKMNGTLFSICFTGVIVAYGLATTAGNTLLPMPGCSTQQAVGGLWIFLRMARFGGTAFGIVLYIPILIVLMQENSYRFHSPEQKYRIKTSKDNSNG